MTTEYKIGRRRLFGDVAALAAAVALGGRQAIAATGADASGAEASGPIKMVTLLTRRSGMTMAEFKARYESSHRLIGEKYLNPYAIRYVRRYCVSPEAEAVQNDNSRPCDVVMEIWFENQAKFDACMADLMRPEVQEEIIADELQQFDRSKIVSFVVDEVESVMPLASA